MWLVHRETAATSVHVLCTPYNNVPDYSVIQSYMRSGLLVHAGLFECFHIPHLFAKDYNVIFLCLCDLFVLMWSFCMCMYTRGTSVYGLIWRAFVESAQNLTRCHSAPPYEGWIQTGNCTACCKQTESTVPVTSCLWRATGRERVKQRRPIFYSALVWRKKGTD